MEDNLYDAIIVGTGAAGLFTALSLPNECKVLMITKDEITKSDSYLAQGGIATLRSLDDYDSYYEDTMKAGRYKNNPESVQEMICSSQNIISKLVDYKVDFDKTKEGTFEYTREGGHSTYRILHHQDITGKEIVEKLLMEVKKHNNISILENTWMLDLIIKNNECSGIVSSCEEELSCYYGKAVYLATGGLGGIFKNSTNYSHITGDGLCISLRHGIEIHDINYIQIHPTVLYSQKEGRRFLISESVRGEGAVLLNEKKERFVNELLPRDLLTEAIYDEMNKYHTNHVYLSLANIKKEKILRHFPNIYNRCLEEGYDAFDELIPVTPAQHYLMGGIKTNINGRTSAKHLYAVGETACNGVHGANRLASNSLLESLVFARNAARCFVESDYNHVVLQPCARVDLEKYKDKNQWQKENRKLLSNEIKRRDKNFYDKWCKFKG
ncbi:aspartate oxidase [Lachnotalea glycerini]|uniref:L-aspartate oxidase n=1 Tax=Lachnotalea glycerini TaxID=1763509 RepID=A0A318EMB2_9FIRM|nr:L-aspartate oxidase [Lachnotalea glycerini]PXV85668.1 aspartate oxidase [Lachnotalea glycerini]